MQNLMLSFEMLQAVATMCPDGFTIDKNTFKPITSGYSVAVADTQNSFDNAGCARVVAYAAKHNEVNALGGWLNTENGKYYYDAVIVCEDLNEAIALGKAHGQIAIFDLNNMVEIRL